MEHEILIFSLIEIAKNTTDIHTQFQLILVIKDLQLNQKGEQQNEDI